MSMTRTEANFPTRQGFTARFWGIGIVLVGAATLMNMLVVQAAQALFPVAPTFVPLQLASVIPATLVAVTGALLVLALLSRRSSHPARLFRRVAVGVLLISLIPDLLLNVVHVYPGTTLHEVGTLMLMHVLTALLCIGLTPRLVENRVQNA